MKKSELKALIREVVEEVTAATVPQIPMSEKAIIKDFLSSLMRKYPNIYAVLEKTEDYPEIPNEYSVVIDSDYMVQVLRRPNGDFVLKKGNPVFYLDAAYSDDETRKRILNKDEMINAIGRLLGFEFQNEKIKNKINKYLEEAKANNGIIQNVYLGEFNLTRLPDFSKFKIVDSFSCNLNRLTSLQGAPQSVGGDFICFGNRLTSLQGAPQSVGGDFICFRNNLTSLQGAPQSVGGEFICDENELTSLKGAPKNVGGDFSCSYNKLRSLQGAPKNVGGDFSCDQNPVTFTRGDIKKAMQG